MSISSTFPRLALATIAALGFVIYVACAPAAVSAAGGVNSRATSRAAVAAAGSARAAGVALSGAVSGTDAVSATQTLSAGLTSVVVPRQVVSGGQLGALVQTAPEARVIITIGFPDGTNQVLTRRAARDGVLRVSVPITYQPQGSAEALTVVVEAIKRPIGLDDIVHGTVAVQQHIVLTGTIITAPRVAVPGRALVVQVHSSPAGALVRIRLAYPDGQSEGREGYTDAGGNLSRRFVVSGRDGAGKLQLTVWLSYSGVQRRLPIKTIVLAAPHAR